MNKNINKKKTIELNIFLDLLFWNCWTWINKNDDNKHYNRTKYIGAFTIYYFGLVKLGWIKMMIKNITIELNISVLTRFSIPDCIVFHVYYFSNIELGWIKMMIKNITIELNISVLSRSSILDYIVFNVYYFSIIEFGWIKIMLRKPDHLSKYIGVFSIFYSRPYRFTRTIF